MFTFKGYVTVSLLILFSIRNIRFRRDTCPFSFPDRREPRRTTDTGRSEMKLTVTSIIISVTALLFCTPADAGVHRRTAQDIITENFRIMDAAEAEVPANEVLGTLGNRIVVTGERAPDHLAFVKTSTDHNYIITGKLLVRCGKNDCSLPPNLHISKLSTSVYEITAETYDQWEKLMTELPYGNGVRQVSPSYLLGTSTSHKHPE